MRLTFPNGEHDDVFFGVGGVAIGSSDEDDICLDAKGVRPRHVELRVEQRGLLLHVPHPASMVTVNGRRVFEQAFLRLGDEIHLSELCIHVTADPGNHREPPDEEISDDGTDDLACAVNLRGVSGDWQGRVINLRGVVQVGAVNGDDNQIRIDSTNEELHVDLIRNRHEVYLRTEEGTSLLNGNPVRNAVLEPGDQLQWGDQRFVLEAPNPPRPDSHRLSSTAVMQAVPDLAQAAGSETQGDGEDQPSAGDGRIAWIIAAILAAGAIATLVAFYFKDRLTGG